MLWGDKEKKRRISSSGHAETNPAETWLNPAVSTRQTRQHA
jgi:hypothetical protein